MNERGLTPIPLQAMGKYDVNRAGAVEALWAPLYDTVTYPAAGTTELLFFQIPQGQSGKTADDTSMVIAGSLPSPQEFIITSVSLEVYPTALPSRVGAAELATNWNDVYELLQSGHLVLRIGSKDYIIDAPIGKFPPRFGQVGTAALTGNNADAATDIVVDYARFGGPVYEIVPYRLIPTQNFSVKLRWDNGVVAITDDAVIRCSLGGYLYRLSQ